MIRAALAWAFYWTGDMVERWNDNDRRFTSAGFRLYQWLMHVSDTIQGPSGRGPWAKVTAQGIDARSGATTKIGAIGEADESPVAEGHAPE